MCDFAISFLYRSLERHIAYRYSSDPYHRARRAHYDRLIERLYDDIARLEELREEEIEEENARDADADFYDDLDYYDRDYHNPEPDY